MWEGHSFLQKELQAFERYLSEKYPGEQGLLMDLSRDAVIADGKRLRPALTILCAMLGEYQQEKVFPIAAAIETVHTATLIHDDIIDNAKVRRGKPTVSEKHGINLAVYTGDYLLANAVLLLSQSGISTEMIAYVAKAAKLLCTGEANQYVNRYRFTSVTSYLRRIMKKTGILFTAACVAGAYAAGLEQKQTNQMARFGLNLGVAFQIRDDLIDLDSDWTRHGKPVENDVRQGVITLPFLMAASQDESIKRSIEDFYRTGKDLKDIIKAVKTGVGCQRASRLKQRYVQRCDRILGTIPRNETRLAMEELLHML